MARIADSIRVGVGPDATGFWKKFETRVRAQKTPNLEVPVNPGLKKANAELAAWRKAQERDALNIPIRVDERQFKRSVRRIEHTFKQSNLSKAIRLQVYVAGASSLPLLAQGAMSATVAITDLGRALYSLPGLASGALAVVGTLATGLRGLGDAFDAISDASKDSGRKLKDYARAAGDLERAQRNVVQALKEANRAIQDQRDKLSQGALSVEQAVLNVQKANERLAKGGFESWTEYRQAVLDAKQAQLDLRETVKQHNRDIQDYHDNAHIAATETDTVKDAVNRLKDAIDDFNKSQREANGLTDKYLEAMSKLGPVARDFVHQVRGLSDEWQRLQNAVSDQLLAGLGDQIVDLAQRRLPVLQAGMEKVAKGLNSNFKQILSAFDTPENVDRISKIFDNMSAALHRANPGIQSLLTGFLHLSEVGSRFLPRMADAFNRVMERFEKFVARTDEDGSLERWIDRGLKLMASLGRSIIYIGSILNSVTEAYEAATGNIGGFTATMERGLKSLSEFLRSPRGQKAMKDYLHDAKLFFDAIKDAMPGIIDLFQAFSEAARNYATVAFPIFAAIGRFLANNAQLSQNLLTVWMLWRTARPVFDMVQKAIFRMGDGMRAYLDRLEAARKLEQARSALLLKQRTAERKYNAERIQHIQHTNMELDKLNRAQKQHTEALTRAKDLQKRAFQDVAVTQAGMLKLQQKRIRAEESYQRMVEKWGAESRYTKAAATRLAKAYAYEAEAIRVHQQALSIYRVASEDVKRHEEAVGRAAAKRAQVVSASNEKVRQSWHAHNVQMQKVNTEIGKVDRAFTKMAGPGGTFGRFRTAIGTTGGAGVLGSLGALGVAIGGVGRDLDQVDRKSRRLADNAGGFGRLRSAIGGRGSGLVGRLGMLGAVLGGSAVSIGVSVGVSIGIIALLEQLAAAQRDAAAAAEEHERRVRELKNTLDSSTGAVTAQTTDQALEQAREFEIRTKDNKPVTVDVIGEAGKLGIDTSTLGRSVDPTQIDAVNHVHESAVNNVVEAIRSGQDQQWNSFGESLKKYGVDERTYAEALIGVPAAKEKFDRARERMAKDVPFSMGGRFVPKGALPDLHTGVENLYRTAPGIAVGQLQQRSLEANRQGGEDIKQRRRPARLNAAGQAKFGQFGVGDVFVSPDGRSVVLNLDRISREQLNALERDPNSGGISVNNILTENPDGTLRVSIHLDPEAASRFVNFYKGGAVFGGPTGRDTVPAMLSNGEFVLSKEAVDYWGVDRLAAMNDLKPPGYFLGGLVKDVDFTKPFKAVGNFVGNLFGGNKQEEPKPQPDPNKMASLFGVEPPKDVAPSLKGMGDRGRVDQRVTGVPSPLNDPLKAMQGVKPASQGPEPNLPFTPSRPQSKTPAPVSDPLRAMTGAGGVSASSQPNLPFTPSDYPVGRRGGAPTTKDYISGAFTQILNTFGIRGPAVHPALRNRTNLVADAARSVFSSVTGLPSNFGTGAAKLPGEESSPRRVEPERRIVDPLRAPLQGRKTPREAPGLFDIIGAKPPRRSGPVSRQPAPGKPAPGKPAPGKPAPPAPTPHQGTGSPPGQSSTHTGTGTPPGVTDTHRGSGQQPGSTPPSVTATLPGGQVVELDMSGSGALADNEATARSAVQGAPILPEANILKYLRDIGKQWGLFEGVSTFRPSEPSSQHSRGRAIDLGGGDAAWSDPSKIEPFVQWWISDPVRVRSTRQLIFAAPSGRKYGIINGRLLSDEETVQVFGGGNPATLGGHADHVHLALEGVPINAVASAAPAPGAPIDPTAPGVPIDPTTPGAPIDPTIPGAPIDPNQPFPQQGIPGVDGPIPGPFGPIPFEPLDFLQRIGQAILQAIFGFFGIDISPILDWVNQGISGIPKQQVGPAGQVDVIDQLPPDPGYDPQVAAQMDQMADQARRDGDHDLATALENAAKSYKNRETPGVPSAMPSSGQIIPHLPRSGLLPGQTSATPSPQEVKNANRALARSMFKNYFPESEWEAFDQLVMRESGYDNWAKNPNSSAFGIGQFLDTTWAQYGWGGERGAATSDPSVQLDLMFRYIRDRYGTPSAALAFHSANNYYRRGGPIKQDGPGHYDQWLWDLYQKEGRFQEFRPLAFLAQNYPGSGASIGNARGGLIKAWRGGPIKQGPLDNIFGHEADEDWVHSIYDAFYGGNVFDVAMENAQGGLIRKARGGMVRGPGGPTDDKIPALLSNGEFVMRAKAVKALGAERLAAMNEAPQRFASGGPVIDPKLFPGGVPGPIPQPDAPHQGTGAPPGPPPPGHTPGQPLSIAPALSGLGGLFAPKGGGGSGGVGRPASTERRDPRSNLMAPPEKTDHLHPALRKGIEGAAQTIGSIAATAASTAGSLAGATTPAGPGASAAGAAVASGIQAGAQMAGQVASGVANVVSALLVGNITPGTAGEGSGVPVLPERPANQFTTVHNGDIVTNNLDEWQRTQDRREAQRTLPFLNRF